MTKRLLLYILCFPLLLHAQDSKTFTRNQEFYLRGNTKVIGNNILSRDATKAFSDDDRVNDEFKMEYVDIDTDPMTFSSSAAYLDIDENATIVYAALYWTGTYYGERSAKRFKNDRTYYKKTDERAHDMQEIKFQVGDKGYEEVRGELIYDGEKARNRTMQSRSPYVCFADVTELVKEASSKSGNYTVANVAATQGQILGGSSAGWMLYLVYEQASEPLQYITTYHGLEFVNRQAVEIEFGNFRSVEKGEVETAVTIGALEGDANLSRDQVGIYNPEEDTFITLDNTLRASSNFFNSTITLNDEVYGKRRPNSRNTLGFDIAKLRIPNAQNAIIANNASGVKLEFKTRSDRYFLFFTAFQTTISETFYETVKRKEDAPVVASPVPLMSMPEPSETVDEIEEDPETTELVHTSMEDIAIPEVQEAVEEKSPELERVINKPSVLVPDFEKGYYIITNVFSSASNAKRWSEQMRGEGLSPETFLRPDNNFYYVYVNHGENPEPLYKILKELRTNPKLTDSWMLKINMD